MKPAYAPELLLELANQAALDLVKVLELLEGHKDDDGLAAALQLELLGRHYVQVVQVSLHVHRRNLEVHQLLRNLRLEVVGRRPLGLLYLHRVAHPASSLDPQQESPPATASHVARVVQIGLEAFGWLQPTEKIDQNRSKPKKKVCAGEVPLLCADRRRDYCVAYNV